jgi:hypothetical protein
MWVLVFSTPWKTCSLFEGGGTGEPSRAPLRAFVGRPTWTTLGGPGNVEEATHEWGPGMPPHGLHWTDLYDPPRLHDEHGASERLQVTRVVGRYDGGATKVPQMSPQPAPHASAQLGVQGGEWLVEQEGVGIRGDRTGKGHSLLLATGQGLGEPMHQVLCVEARKRVARSVGGGRPTTATERHIGHNVQVWKKAVALRNVTDAALVGPNVDPDGGVQQDA